MATALVPSMPLPSANGAAFQPPPAPDAEITAQLLRITPEMATDLLRNRLPNRPVSKARVRLMIEDLRANRWKTNGESIILDANLRVLDGQHRLMACVESGIAIVAMVVVGAAPEVMPSIDQGRAKSAGDVLTMAGMEHAPQLASAARWLWKYENRSMRSSSVVLKNYELPAFVAQHSGLHASLSWGRSLRSLMPPSCASLLYYVTSSQDPALAKSFFAGLATGAELKPSDAAYIVRERLLKSKERWTHAVIVNRAAITVLAWNCLRQGWPCSPTLSWRGVTDPDTAFPSVV